MLHEAEFRLDQNEHRLGGKRVILIVTNDDLPNDYSEHNLASRIRDLNRKQIEVVFVLSPGFSHQDRPVCCSLQDGTPVKHDNGPKLFHSFNFDSSKYQASITCRISGGDTEYRVVDVSNPVGKRHNLSSFPMFSVPKFGALHDPSDRFGQRVMLELLSFLQNPLEEVVRAKIALPLDISVCESKFELDTNECEILLGSKLSFQEALYPTPLLWNHSVLHEPLRDHGLQIHSSFRQFQTMPKASEPQTCCKESLVCHLALPQCMIGCDERPYPVWSCVKDNSAAWKLATREMQLQDHVDKSRFAPSARFVAAGSSDKILHDDDMIFSDNEDEGVEKTEPMRPHHENDDGLRQMASPTSSPPWLY